MIKENKFKVIISTIIILLPCLIGIILWDKLPNTMAIHWDISGTADGFSSKAFVVFGMPFIFLGLQILSLIGIKFDKNSKGHNKKALAMVFWIIPFISLFINALVYSFAFDNKFNFVRFVPVIFGIMFITIGNYMPKITQNKTLGIKIKWTLSNEENWNKTHRFAGKIWVIMGCVVFLCVLLPEKLLIATFIIALFISILVPYLFSYSIYRKHKQDGIKYDKLIKTKADKIGLTITAIFVPLILIFVAILMFTGDVNVIYNSDSFKIEASYCSDLEVKYQEIDSLEYQTNFDKGSRRYGYGSAKLSIGTFDNDEFGRYTLYAYNKPNDAVVIKSDKKVLVVTGKTNNETKEIYNKLLEKISD